MDEDIVLVVIAGLFIGVFLGFCVFFESDQNVIDNINQRAGGAICIERKVGKDLIKKCYKLEEVK